MQVMQQMGVSGLFQRDIPGIVIRRTRLFQWADGPSLTTVWEAV